MLLFLSVIVNEYDTDCCTELVKLLVFNAGLNVSDCVEPAGISICLTSDEDQSGIETDICPLNSPKPVFYTYRIVIGIPK